MNVSLTQEIYDLIQETSSSNSDDINDKIKAICDNMQEATNIGQTIYEMYDNLVKEKNEIDENNHKYAILTVGALNELDKSQISGKPVNFFPEKPTESLNTNEIKKMLSGGNQHIFTKIDSVFEEIDNRLIQTEEKLSAISQKSSNIQIPKESPLPPFFREIQDTFHCSIEEIPSFIQNLIGENNAKKELLDSIQQKFTQFGEEDFLDGIDSVVRRSEFIQKFCQEFQIESKSEQELKSFADAVNHIERIAKILKTNVGSIDTTIVSLIDTINFQRKEIEELQNTQEKLLSDLKHNPIQTKEFEYNRFDHLVNIRPNENSSNSQSSLFESKIDSMNENISQMKNQYQEAMKNFEAIQERKQNEIGNLKLILKSKETENQLKESKIRTLTQELNFIKDKNSQNNLIQTLSSFFGSATNESEILARIYDLNNENIKLRIQLNDQKRTQFNSFQSKSSQESDDQIRIQLNQQIYELTKRNQSLSDLNLTLKTSNTQYQQELEKQAQINQTQENQFRQENKILKESNKNFQREIDELKCNLQNYQVQTSQLENQIEKIRNQSEKLSNIVIQFSSQNQIDKSIQDILNVLQILFLQFSLNDFSKSEDALHSALSNISQIKSNGFQIHFDVNRKVGQFINKISQQYEFINHNLNDLIRRFNQVKEKVIDAVEEQKGEILDFMENDFSAPYAALQVSFRELQGKYDLLISNQEREQNPPQYITTNPPGHIQSRFVSPVRNQARNKNVLSPSARIIDETIRHNANNPW